MRAQLFANYNGRQQDDVLIFHEGDFTAADQRAVIDERNAIRFVRLATRYWSMPASVASDNQTLWEQPRFSLGYRHMLRWYSITIWPCLEAMGYEFVMRMDEESFLLSPIGYNLFTYMRQRGLEYGYRMASFESGGLPASGRAAVDERFHSFVREYLFANGLQPTMLLRGCEGSAGAAAADVGSFSVRRCGDLYGFYNNWFISRLSFWQTQPVRHFLHHVDRSGHQYRRRWNDRKFAAHPLPYLSLAA